MKHAFSWRDIKPEEYLALSGWSTQKRIVRKMLEMADPKPGETLYDAGCGDGRFLVEASKTYGIKSVGIECEEKRVRTARENIRKNGLENLATVIQGNVFDHSFEEADIVTLYLDDDGMNKIRGKLAAELPGDARVVSHWYSFEGIEPTKYKWVWAGIYSWPLIPKMPLRVIARYDAKDLKRF